MKLDKKLLSVSNVFNCDCSMSVCYVLIVIRHTSCTESFPSDHLRRRLILRRLCCNASHMAQVIVLQIFSVSIPFHYKAV